MRSLANTWHASLPPPLHAVSDSPFYFLLSSILCSSSSNSSSLEENILQQSVDSYCNKKNFYMRILFSRSGSTFSALLLPFLQGVQRPVARAATAKFLFGQQSVMTAVDSQSLHHQLFYLPGRACSSRRNESVVVVMGATGTGKSKLSIDLATRFPSEVVNSDKIQVYRGLDITTNKIPLAERCGVPHHLLGELDPEAGELPALKFRSLAASAIEGIAARRRLPVVAGGSNSFIHALLAARHDPRVDPFAAGDSRRGRRERLRYRCCFLWVDVEKKVLAEYLDRRVEEMAADGMVAELEAYFAAEGAEPGRHPGLEKAIGVPEFREYFEKGKGAKKHAAAVAAIKANTRRLAEEQVRKIGRLGESGCGWALQRVDATAAVRARLEGSAWAAAWDRDVVGPSVAAVESFLESSLSPPLGC
ncbi:adenylate isopentenyltransferase-like [Phoenix dactylifera]|uniref:Adenylate isopentenyltransferase-like n=1 Tax=Phoenix dactylifera TaxID=42345 RepID=A0A8B7CEP8_PHODC|nr:adenylate isopentenyltransferase-like [Phoenix dactylifera]